MDPLTIVGLIANVVQLGDASVRAAEACYQVYKQGATLEVQRLAETAGRLDRCYEQLEKSSIDSKALAESGSDRELVQLTQRCRETAQKLQQELADCRRSPRGGRRDAAAKFLTTQWRARRIEKMKKTLDEDQKILEHVIQADMSQRLRSIATIHASQGTDLKQRLDVLSAGLLECQSNTSKTLQAFFDDIAKQIAVAHTQTRQEIQTHVTQEHTATRQMVHDIPGHIDTAFDTLKLTQDENELSRNEQRFRESLRFHEMNSRKNDIKKSYPETFDWIFREDATESQKQFHRWLQNDSNVFWVNGKPGSGKSTLMKFIVDDTRTTKDLQVWAKEQQLTIVSIFFWLSGAEFQRNMRGFLSSFLYQLLENAQLLRKVFNNNAKLVIGKSHLSDWSTSELRQFLDTAIGIITQDHKICAFLDGIDECDRNDTGDLFKLINDLRESPDIKFCVSSRPETYLEEKLKHLPSLRLQDLTEQDIRTSVISQLKEACPHDDIRAIIGGYRLDELVQIIVDKAEGVFLWVHFALRSVLRGIENEDDFKTLEKRIEALPSGMAELYQEMWKRHNGDEIFYQQEASRYFSYHEYFPLSVFQMMVACDKSVQERYLSSLTGLGLLETKDRCATVQKRVRSRCAGLLQLTERESEDGYPDRFSAPFEARLLDDSTWSFVNTEISFIHRTARDFLVGTETGKVILGVSERSQEELAEDIVSARIAALLQAPAPVTFEFIDDIIEILPVSDPSATARLLNKLKDACDAVTKSSMYLQSLKTTQMSFEAKNSESQYYGYHWDILSCLANGTDVTLLSIYVQHMGEYMTSYYLGHLFCDLFSDFLPHSGSLQLAISLLKLGADVCTTQWFKPFRESASNVRKPVEIFIEGVFELFARNANDRDLLSSEVSQILKEGSPELSDLEDIILVKMYQYGDYEGREHVFWVQLTIKEACRIISDFQKDHRADCLSLRHKALSTDSYKSIKLVGFFSRSSGLDSDTEFMITTKEDSEIMGRALVESFRPVNRVEVHDGPDMRGSWSSEEYVDLLEDVKQRCQIVRYGDWLQTRGRMARRQPDAKFLDPYVEVDQTNWWSVGWGFERQPVDSMESLE